MKKRCKLLKDIVANIYLVMEMGENVRYGTTTKDVVISKTDASLVNGKKERRNEL